MNPAAFLNHNSYAILAAALLLFAAWQTLRVRVTWRRIALFAVVAALLALPPLYVRAGVARSAGALDAALASGRPTLLEVYSAF